MHTTLTARSITSAGAVLATAALLLTGCSSAKTVSATSAGSTTAATASASPSATGGASGATPGSSDGATASGGSVGTGTTGTGSTVVVVVHNADKGKTVTLHPGQTLEVVLDGGYWAAPSSSAASVLRLSRQPSFSSPSPGRGCPPGVGCRAEVTDFMAVSAGTATVSSSRSQCGEAMRCTDANSKFDVTVTVVA